MYEKLIEPYEISVWKDKLVNGQWEEVKLAVIGSNEMTAYNKIYEPVFTKKNNGEKTLTFSLKYKYYDPYIEAEIVNPFASFLTNESKVKLHYNNKWYEFIIKEHVESSDGLIWTYTAKDAFVIELSKNGYNIEFSAELNNNQGTAEELAEKSVEGTDWQIESEPLGPSLIEEPIYNATLSNLDKVTIVKANETEPISISAEDVFVFYSYVANKDGKFVQFIIKSDTLKEDENGSYIEDNYRILDELYYYEENGQEEFRLKTNDNDITIITIGEIETQHQAFRSAYTQLTTYDVVKQRTVNCYEISDDERRVFSYDDYQYSISSVLVNYITNGGNFNILENGTIQGWDIKTDSTEGQELKLVTKPELVQGKTLAELTNLNQIEGFLKAKLNAFDSSTYQNTLFNSGIEDFASTIGSIIDKEKFVFRFRAGRGGDTPDNLSNDDTLKCIVAKYSKVSDGSGYVNKIDPTNIILQFDGAVTEKNNYITEGEFTDEDTNYRIDGVIQVPSTKYIYKQGDKELIWNIDEGKYVAKDNNYLNYYYLTAEARRAVSNTELQDPKEKFGIFIYTSDGQNIHYIQDVQITRYIEDKNGDIVLLGNVPVGAAVKQTYYYVEPRVGSKEEDITLYTSLDGVAKSIGKTSENITPIYNGNEKVLSIEVSRSNCFNALQTIAETFECWLDFKVIHEDDGRIAIEDGKPQKYIVLKPYMGKDNFAGFKYAINLDTIERTINSEEVTTKLIVAQIQSEYVDEGAVSITNAKSNLSGESYILNFEYYYNQGLLDRESAENDILVFNTDVKTINDSIYEKQQEKINLENSILKLTDDRNVYTTLIDSAKDNVNRRLADFEKLSNGVSYDDYQKSGVALGDDYRLTGDTEVKSNKDYYIRALTTTGTYAIQEVATVEEGIRFVLPQQSEDWTSFALEIEVRNSYERDKYDDLLQFDIDTSSEISLINDCGVITYNAEDKIIEGVLFNESNEYNRLIITSIIYEGPAVYAFEKVTNPSAGANPKTLGWYETQNVYADIDEFYDIVGELYVNSAAINNYSGLLTNIETEYRDLRSQLNGDETFTITTEVIKDNDQRRIIKIIVSDYLAPLIIKIGESEYPVDINNKYFYEYFENLDEITFEITNEKYVIEGYGGNEVTVQIQDEVVETFTLLPNTNKQPSIEDEINDLIEQKKEIVNNFTNKYSRYIQEGTWESNEYIDPELYYLDALQVSNTSSQPQVTYSINVVEISKLEGYEYYSFDVGDKTYIEDTEFFGWNVTNTGTNEEPNLIYTPAREEVIISEVEWHLEEPDKNVITIQNYKTRFEDLFQRVSAAVQTVQYNEATYAKITSLLDKDGTINQDVLLQSLNNLNGKKQNLTSDGSIIINGPNIIVQNLTNSQNLVKISNEGIGISSDGGNTWRTAIDGAGIDIGAVRTGSLNTDTITIGSPDNPSFRWDSYGINAFRSGENGYDPKTFVRYDQYGLYGIKNSEGYVVNSLEDVKDKAHFAVTWDGFFIKNSYEDGGRVSITSDNDFQVIDGNDIERIKIGSIGFDGQGNRIYGINISNNNGDSVFNTDNAGNVTITGTINATGGNFRDKVTVGIGSPYIAIDGSTAEIYSSNYSDGAGTGWLINKDGDAYFNNITARGAIKTAVFEYAEIQAVGGIFIFRPSSTIKAARIDNNDLILKVEKPYLFAKIEYDVIADPSDNPKEYGWYERNIYGYVETEDEQVDVTKTYYQQQVIPHSWCKVSNYTNDGREPDISNVLATNGLTHVYEISDVDFTTKEVTLAGAAVMVSGQSSVTTLEELEGGALIDMGRKSGTADYDDGIHNYGIGVNSSDNTVNLPARAISLFETVIDESHEPKVTYKYKGILGTLPELPANSVNSTIYNNMVGTQGIYTDNMYLGDFSQYMAFYVDKTTGERKLKIRASSVEFGAIDPETHQPTGDYHDVAEIEAEGVPGPPGKDAITVQIDSSAGTIFVNNIISTILRCYVYKGGEDITHNNAYTKVYTWKKINIIDGSEVQGWTPTPVALEPNAIAISARDVDSKAVFQCTVNIEEV